MSVEEMQRLKPVLPLAVGTSFTKTITIQQQRVQQLITSEQFQYNQTLAQRLEAFPTFLTCVYH